MAEFEAAAAEFLGCRHAVATSSGTASIRAALAALGVGCGDEVIVPAFTFIASVNAIVVSGAVPVFAEVDDTLGLAPDDVAAKVNSKTAAIMAVHLDNGACDMDAVLTAAADVPVLEDTAQAMGATYKGRALGRSAPSARIRSSSTRTSPAVKAADCRNDEDLYVRARGYQDRAGSSSRARGRNGAARPSRTSWARTCDDRTGGCHRGVQLSKARLLAAQRANQQRVLKAIAGLRASRRAAARPEGDGGSASTCSCATATRQAVYQGDAGGGHPHGQLYGGRPVYLTPSIVAKRTPSSGKGGPWNGAEHPTTSSTGWPLSRGRGLVGRAAVVLSAAAYTEGD